MCSNIPAKPTYGVYVSQLIRISRICDNYVSFVKRHRLLAERLIKQGFWYNKLSVSFKKFSRRHSMLFNKYAVSVKRECRAYNLVIGRGRQRATGARIKGGGPCRK